MQRHDLYMQEIGKKILLSSNKKYRNIHTTLLCCKKTLFKSFTFRETFNTRLKLISRLIAADVSFLESCFISLVPRM